MNAIPAFITSLSFLHHKKVIQLSVQCLNEMFWGSTLEQLGILQYLPASWPAALVPFMPVRLMSDDDDVEQMFFFS